MKKVKQSQQKPKKSKTQNSSIHPIQLLDSSYSCLLPTITESCGLTDLHPPVSLSSPFTRYRTSRVCRNSPQKINRERMERKHKLDLGDLRNKRQQNRLLMMTSALGRVCRILLATIRYSKRVKSCQFTSSKTISSKL